MIKFENANIAIIGLGYVGLPLAVEFGKFYNTVGFDINNSRIEQLKSRKDFSLEVDSYQFDEAKYLSFSHNSSDIQKCNFFIVTVPTPIDKENKPDFEPLLSATKLIGKYLKKDDIVIYESTVFPGATEEICVPILEEHSKLKFNEDFYCGYSPERINPGDRSHRLPSIKKITSGSTKKTADQVDRLYRKIITAGTFMASSIKIAEAAKVIENTQRDINIALINEFSLIFKKLEIDTQEVLDAANTKWNFLNFRPGLVGGHCIGVDPYYLTYKALQEGYEPKMILAGRELNESMGSYIANELIQLMIKNKIEFSNSNILILGFSFKENCPDSRNTRVIDIVNSLQKLNCNVDIYDPWINSQEVFDEYGIHPIEKPEIGKYDAAIVAVAHDEFKQMNVEGIQNFCNENSLIYDVKHIFDKNKVDGRL